MASENHPPRILVLGCRGQVGSELQHALADLGEVVALGRAEADLSAPEALRAVVRQHAPRVIVNAAAYTAVDKAESEPDLAQVINGVAPGVLAEEARALDACLVHYSTDYVFDGCKASPYQETDATHPLSVYGRSKLAGEQAIVAAGGRYLILRTSWVFGAGGNNFLKTMLRLARERDRLQVVGDQIGAPTSAALIARTTATVLAEMQSSPGSDRRWGIYHLVAGGETSWHEYAVYILEKARERGVELKVNPEQVGRITTAEYPTPARRPANSRLDTRKLCTTFPVDLPHWTREVDSVLHTLLRAER